MSSEITVGFSSVSERQFFNLSSTIWMTSHITPGALGGISPNSLTGVQHHSESTNVLCKYCVSFWAKQVLDTLFGCMVT